jgi:hypothetical protein
LANATIIRYQDLAFSQHLLSFTPLSLLNAIAIFTAPMLCPLQAMVSITQLDH